MQVPTFRMTVSGDDMVKYKPEPDDLTEANLRSFVASVKAGEVKPHLKTEPLPEDWNAGPVKVQTEKILHCSNINPSQLRLFLNVFYTLIVICFPRCWLGLTLSRWRWTPARTC